MTGIAILFAGVAEPKNCTGDSHGSSCLADLVQPHFDNTQLEMMRANY